MSEVPLDGQVTGGDMSTKVKIKAEKDEIPVKHYKNDDDTEKEKAGIPDGDKAVLHTKLLEQCQQELITVKDKLIKTERQLEKANAYNEDLRGELDKLSSELHSLKRAARENRTDAETQTEDQQDSSTERHGLSEDQAIVIDDSINEGNEDKTDGDSKRTTKSTKTLESAETEDGARTDKDGKVKESASTESDTKTKDDNKMEHDAKVEKEAKEGEEQVSSTSLADELRATAEAAVQQTGYVYDENSGLYYDYNSGYYYNAEKALYYDPNTGTYFYYNSETGKYDFHSLVDLSQYSTGQDSQQYNNYYGQDHSSSDRGGNYDLTRKDYQAHSSHRHSDSGYDQYHRPLPRRDRETSRSSKSYEEYDHHISSQRRDKEGSSRMDSGKKKKTKRLQTEEMDKEEYEGVISALEGLRIKTAKETALELVSQWPPCIRVIVTDSDTIDPGNLFIITCTGATVGREKEMGHTILIPDINVSKAHAEIQFDEKEYKYYLTDLSSQNGTFLNEERVSEPKVKSKPMVLSHGDTLQFGCTRLLLHIHDGTDTCDECEPGQVQAQLQAQNQPKKEIVILSKEEKLRQQRQELKKIKKKYGLKNSAYVDNMGAINNPAYNDKADERRKTVGSDNPYQPDEVPASVHRPISEENKGHKMLKKLGWTEGDSLGKDNEGIRQPISVKFRANKSAGLGSGGAGEGSVQEVGDLKRRQKWMNAQRRYNKMDQDNVKIGSGRDKQTLTTPKWVQGETQEGETQEG
ncbi:angiogenic factor with G patch and FHA domains 1-like isoform X2 [Mizuhopecten yessoensis]|uniref:Angiogenic factor with G patch and FHA domains 1 n=1 Tax=Mizuhopecten yessoensis TaxID=6573 RepID=A0A210QZ40_MIZYE|nr:angiogenic factor with G patch and FHA domains 1-like isoform X2 [Mizuhopecten yessoensis]OWF53997.1 Angiogenic factor with G patch and FHA domains 1 [Mizuhopecten yessoensis]